MSDDFDALEEIAKQVTGDKRRPRKMRGGSRRAYANCQARGQGKVIARSQQISLAGRKRPTPSLPKLKCLEGEE